MPFIQIPSFPNARQQKTFWCWAAVSANVYNSMSPPAPKSQCDVVTLVEGNCDGNSPESLSLALFQLGINDEFSTRPRFAVVGNEFRGIVEKLDPPEGLAEPVCAEIMFPGPAFHAVAISAVDTDTQHVWVADPFLGGDPVEFTWNDFVNNYNYAAAPLPAPGVVQNLQRVVNPKSSSKG